MTKLGRSSEFWFGLFCIALAAVSLFAITRLNVGTLSSPGAGFFPRAISILILAFGGLFVVRAFIVGGEPADAWHWRPLLVISGALFVFAMMVRWSGLPLATVTLTAIAAFASDEMRLIDVVFTALALSVFGALLFVYALGIPLPLLPIGLR